MNIKKIIRETLDNFDDDFSWVRNVPSPEITDQNKFMVLVNILGIDEVLGDVTGFDDPNTDFQENTWSHYGIDTFTLNNGQEWAVGTPNEFDEALYDYWLSYPEEVGFENVFDIQYYLEISDTDKRIFATDMTDSYIGELSDEEIIEMANLEDEWDEINDKISELEDQRDGIDTSIDDEISDLEVKKELLIYNARDQVSSNEINNWVDCLEDPYRCLVREHGLYYDVNDLLNSNFVFFNERTFARDMADNSNYGEISAYDDNYYEDNGYIAIRLN